MTTDAQAEIVAFLSRPDTYGVGAGTVERIETHISIVWLAGARARRIVFDERDEARVEHTQRDVLVRVAARLRVSLELGDASRELAVHRKGARILEREGQVAADHARHGGIEPARDAERIEITNPGPAEGQLRVHRRRGQLLA